MKDFDEQWVGRAIVALVVIAGGVLLAPELSIGRVNLNDAVFHHAIASEIVDRVTHGRSALDFWMPEWSLGYPVLRVYQPLAAWLLALIQIATGQHWPLDQTFAFLRWLLIATFPISIYASCRFLDFDVGTSTGAHYVLGCFRFADTLCRARRG